MKHHLPPSGRKTPTIAAAFAAILAAASLTPVSVPGAVAQQPDTDTTTGTQNNAAGSPIDPNCTKATLGEFRWGYKTSTLNYTKSMAEGLIDTYEGSVYNPDEQMFTFGINNEKSFIADDGSLHYVLNGGIHIRGYHKGDKKFLMDTKVDNLTVIVDSGGKNARLVGDLITGDVGEGFANPKDVAVKGADIANVPFKEIWPNPPSDGTNRSGISYSVNGSIAQSYLWLIDIDKSKKLSPAALEQRCGGGPGVDEKTVDPDYEKRVATIHCVLRPPDNPCKFDDPPPGKDPDPDPDPDPSGDGDKKQTPGGGSSGGSSQSPGKGNKASDDDDEDENPAAGSSKELRDGFQSLYDTVLKGGLSLASLAIVVGVLGVMLQHLWVTLVPPPPQ